jgi:hypothetical protein
MLQHKTHYEQVPLEIVRRILEEQFRKESRIDPHQESREKPLEEELVRQQQQSMASPGKFSTERC